MNAVVVSFLICVFCISGSAITFAQDAEKEDAEEFIVDQNPTEKLMILFRGFMIKLLSRKPNGRSWLILMKNVL